MKFSDGICVCNFYLLTSVSITGLDIVFVSRLHVEEIRQGIKAPAM